MTDSTLVFSCLRPSSSNIFCGDLSLLSSALETSPSLRVRSLPPPTKIPLDPVVLGPVETIFSIGILKYSEIPFKSSLETEAKSHISKKKAIMAVTKSA